MFHKKLLKGAWKLNSLLTLSLYPALLVASQLYTLSGRDLIESLLGNQTSGL